jgi:hypothetical protein
VIKDPPEVSYPFGWGMRPYPSDYKRAFAFSGILYPHAHWLASRRAVLAGLLLRGLRGDVRAYPA